METQNRTTKVVAFVKPMLKKKMLKACATEQRSISNLVSVAIEKYVMGIENESG